MACGCKKKKVLPGKPSPKIQKFDYDGHVVWAMTKEEADVKAKRRGYAV